MEKILEGTLSESAARRLDRLDLAGKLVSYKMDTESGYQVASDVYYDGKRIAGCVSIGHTGIIPLKECTS